MASPGPWHRSALTLVSSLGAKDQDSGLTPLCIGGQGRLSEGSLPAISLFAQTRVNS